jgi:integrase
VPQRIYETLSFDEVRLVIEAAGSTWRNLIATAIYLGLRKGELFALRKQDVDLEDRLLYVRRSHGTDRIDLNYQHRVDPKVPIEDVASAIKDLREIDAAFSKVKVRGGRMAEKY